ncbi:MAG: hypothetical protein EBR82_26880 [Caulobacteraceae bacterium]|nr:hypothetical protein [Caulobacteraceae bacterium]
MNFGESRSLVIPISGGIDSVYCAYAAKGAGLQVKLLHLDAKKDASTMEYHTSKRTAIDLGLPLEVVDIDGLRKLQLGHLPIENIRADELDMSGDPMPAHDITGFYVLLSVSSYYAQIVGADAVVVGVVKDQADERPEISTGFSMFAGGISKINPKAKPLSILSPLLEMDKSEVINEAFAAGVPLSETWSCTSAGYQHCGVCISCGERRAGFLRSNHKDLTVYVSDQS